MKFYNYLNEVEYKQSRSKELSIEQCFKYLKNNCLQSVKQFFEGEKIYRGSRGGECKLTTPTGKRKSANTENYYTLLINNDPSWSKFPKREVICTYNLGYAKNYGRYIYNVFPVDNSKIGICPEGDIWASFNKLEKLGCSELIDFNDDLEKLLNYYNKHNRDTYKDLKQSLIEIPKEDKNIPSLHSNLFTEFYNSNFETFYDYVVWLLDPKMNKFSIEKVNDFVNTKWSEVWTDKPCIMLRYTWLLNNAKEFVDYFKGLI